jgi:anaerobic selenocysteine-containing dehydrogenase
MLGDSDNVQWGKSTLNTACPLDCPDSCSLSVDVEQGQIVTIKGSRRHEVTDGFICAKVRRFGDRVYGEDRLHHPGVRQGPKGQGRFKKVTWDSALDLIAERMTEIRDRHGAEAILPFSYGGSNGLVSQDTADAQLFRRFGTARLARTVCAAPTTSVSRAMYGRMPSVSYPDYRHARLIVIWGANPSTSGIHLVPHIRAAMDAGAALVVIDPRRTNLAKRADVHLQVRPGTDVAVAMSIHRFLFENGFEDEEFLTAHTRGADRLRAQVAAWTFDRAATVADVDPVLLEQVAEMYAEISPAVIRCGWGLERNRNGGNAALAVLALPAVAGKFGVRGGGFTMSNSGAWRVDTDAVIDAPEPSTRLVNMNRLGRALTEFADPPVQMLFVYNCNPAVTMPDQNRVLQGLQREDLFTVVFDQVLTDSARWADVVLPATTFLEHYDVAPAYGPISLQLVQPVIEPVGDSRPNVEVFGDLAKRLGIEVSPLLQTDPEAVMHVAAALPDSVRDSLAVSGIATPECPTLPIQFVDVFPRTPDRKIDLFPDALDSEAPAGIYAYQGETAAETYPLVLLSPATSKTITSTLGELRTRIASIEMHPHDANARDLNTGDTVRVFNNLGEIHCPVRLNPDMKRGTVGLPKGLWRKSTMNGSTANALVADSPTDLGGGACFNDARVEVMRVVTAELGDQQVALWPAKTPIEGLH